MNSRHIAFSLLALSSTLTVKAQNQTGEGVPAFQVRPGYRVTLAAENFGEARFLQFDSSGTLYVSQPGAGTITALRDQNHDGVFETQAKFVEGKSRVHGMDWHDGWLWFTQSGSIHRARDTNADGVADEVVTVVPEGSVPSGGGHWWRSICVTDDGFYTSIGDASNASDQSDTDRQKVWKFNLDGGGKTLWVTGIRNTEKLRLRPGTTELWGADHGSDNYGKSFGESKGEQPITDLLPPCEFNRYDQGSFYGHPFIIGNRLPRQEFATRPDIVQLAAKTTPPAWSLGAHWAPNGWTFLQSDALGLKGDVVIACHGSWNSTNKVGYRIERIMLDPVTGLPMGAQQLVGTLDGEKVLARPVDCVEAADGSILWSCDATKKIYRISRMAR